MSRIFPSLPLLLICLTSASVAGSPQETGSGQAPETWTLNITYSNAATAPSQGGTTTITIKANGSAALQVDRTGRLTGSGTLDVLVTVVGEGLRSKESGQGQFTVAGKRDGQYLVLSVNEGSIPLQGTLELPTGSTPTTDSFDPSNLAPVPTAIDRKEGGISTTNFTDGTVVCTITLSLSGGANVLGEVSPARDVFPKEENIWTLELRMNEHFDFNSPEQSGTADCTVEGKAEFPLPLDDGPAKGEGPMTVRCSSVWNKPMLHEGSSLDEAVLVLDGNIKDDVLTFESRGKFQKLQSEGAPPQYSMPADINAGLWIFDMPNAVSIPVKDGAETVEPFVYTYPNLAFQAKAIWRLKGKKVEYWRATVDQWNTIVFGSFQRGRQSSRGGKSAPSLAGVKVHSRKIIDFVIEDGRYKSGKGTSAIVSIGPYSTSAGVYQCNSVVSSIIGTGTDMEAERWDQVRNAKRFNPKFLTKEDEELKKKWEQIDKHNTPYVFPQTYPVHGSKTGRAVQLTLPEESGYTVAYHCTRETKSASAKRQEVLQEDRFLFKDSIAITLADGWGNTRQFATTHNADNWFEVPHGENTDNRETISVQRLTSGN